MTVNKFMKTADGNNVRVHAGPRDKTAEDGTRTKTLGAATEPRQRLSASRKDRHADDISGCLHPGASPKNSREFLIVAKNNRYISTIS